MKPCIKIVDNIGTEMFVVPGFLNICPNPELHSQIDLLIIYDLLKYLHSLEGPALEYFHYLGESVCIYAIEGKTMDKETWDKIIHAHEFNNATESLLGALDEEKDS